MRRERSGYKEKVGSSRSTASVNPEQNTSPMVQELIARTRFIRSIVGLDGKAILDYGCGTGIALQWIRIHCQPGRMVGLDISEGALASARAHYPGIDFRAMDVEKPAVALAQEFDVCLCLEVLEHLQRPESALSLLSQHYLRPGGVLVATTPNRSVFSNGRRPSPINRTHLNEMNFEEFSGLLKAYFKESRILGMRFKDVGRRQAHARMVAHACRGHELLGELWWNKWLSRFYRWVLCGEALSLLHDGARHRTMASDFEFVDDPLEMSSSPWFLAVAST